MTDIAIEANRKRLRIPALDVARGIALVAMAIFHFAWDLEFFNIAPKGMTLEPQWVYFARSIASSFLMLVGVSAWLAHSGGISISTLVKRITLVGGSALLISLVTYQMMPHQFIFFGILHNITVSSILLLLFIRLPSLVVFLAALFFFSAGTWINTTLFESPIWWWLGLLEVKPVAVDYVPIFPWFGWVLCGLLIARLIQYRDLWIPISNLSCSGLFAGLFAFFGRHSLIFYLVHQPILIALIYLTVKIFLGET